MKITKYPQSAILLDYKDKKILIDPGKYCYRNNFSANDWGKIDILLITHEHADHCLPEAIKVIKENNPELVILSNKSVQSILLKERIKSDALELDDTKNVNGIEITGIKSVHGDMPNGKHKPEVTGFLIDNKVYHPGDTVYMKDKPSAEIVFVPISGVVVMNPEEAAQFATEVRAKIAVPIHYDNPDYPVQVLDFQRAMGDGAIVLANGESVEVEE